MAEEKPKYRAWKYVSDCAEQLNGFLKQPEGSNVGMVAFGILSFVLMMVILTVLDYFLFNGDVHTTTNLVVSIVLAVVDIYGGVKARDEGK